MRSLRCAGAALELLPGLGGSVGRFSVDGFDMLRPTRIDAASPLDTACFPLVPFANRAAHARFDFDGETIRLRRNFGNHPHALHGHGWQNAWRVETVQTDTALLSYGHAADDWPWNYRAEQTFRLKPDSLEIDRRLENRSGRAMPASLGFHPFFHRTFGAILQTEVEGVWLSDDTALPTTIAPPAHFVDLAQGADMSRAPFVDHGHFGWTGRASICWRDRPIALSLTASAELGFLHVFVPSDENYFCAEPVSAMPDALNGAMPTSGLRVLGSGESLTASLVMHGTRSW